MCGVQGFVSTQSACRAGLRLAQGRRLIAVAATAVLHCVYAYSTAACTVDMLCCVCMATHVPGNTSTRTTASSAAYEGRLLLYSTIGAIPCVFGLISPNKALCAACCQGRCHVRVRLALLRCDGIWTSTAALPRQCCWPWLQSGEGLRSDHSAAAPGPRLLMSLPGHCNRFVTLHGLRPPVGEASFASTLSIMLEADKLDFNALF